MDIKIISFLAAVCLGMPVRGELAVQWDYIENWTGNGRCRTALAIQFNDGLAEVCYVWGYRWNPDPETGAAPTVRQMMQEIAVSGSCLDILEQQTCQSPATFTLAGIAMSKNHSALDVMYFDFQGALDDSRLVYNYYAPGGPGDGTPLLCAAAIQEARGSHVVRHPVGLPQFAYPAYDYDHWHVAPISETSHWNAGWNIGNWICWKGSAGNSEYTYAGMSYSNARVADGEVVVWNFNRHSCYPSGNDIIEGYTGATRPVRPACYSFGDGGSSGLRLPQDHEVATGWFDIAGHPVAAPGVPGIYILVGNNGISRKVLVTGR